MPVPRKYATVIADWLSELGYTHCFFVAGGNIMHLLDAARTRFTCIAVVHEVAAGIAVEYFNEVGAAEGRRAFALVTAGPGLTNIVTALAGAFLESRELLVLGGQVKSTDLAGPHLRQRGIQEIDGVAIAKPVAVVAERIEAPIDRATFTGLVGRGAQARKGPVFLEICLDAQGAWVEPSDADRDSALPPAVSAKQVAAARDRAPYVADLVHDASRPVLLLGGGVSRSTASQLRDSLRAVHVPVMTTWNGMDRVDSRDPNFAGRPNTWGQRSANVLIQQADLIVAVGTRLGLQQTGFNHQAFAPLARVVQVDVDEHELTKGHPKVDVAIAGDADTFLETLLEHDLGMHADWLAFCRSVRERLPANDANNVHEPGYLDPFAFMQDLSRLCDERDIVVPCSSGGAFTTAMQAFDQRFGQTVVTDKGLAAMGYGLGGAIGAAFAGGGRRTILCEGDGGFSQNLQELATVAVNALPIKIFLVSNDGYASIRMTQRNYFDGEYLGCDRKSGLGFPNWELLFRAYGIPLAVLSEKWDRDDAILAALRSPGPAAFLVPVDPEQTYFPKITSRVTATGSMESAPLHLMTPPLPPDVAADVLRYVEMEQSTIQA